MVLKLNEYRLKLFRTLSHFFKKKLKGQCNDKVPKSVLLQFENIIQLITKNILNLLNLFFMIILLSFRMPECIVLHVAVGSGGATETRGVSPATRALRRGNRRLTRNESRYHSGECFLHIVLFHFHYIFIYIYLQKFRF